jgi:hypothetical protein
VTPDLARTTGRLLRPLAACLLCVATGTMLTVPLQIRAADNVVMVQIDYFAESHRLRGANDARRAIAAGKPELYTAFFSAYGAGNAAIRKQDERKNTVRHQVLRDMGLVPRAFGRGCILNPEAEAYADGNGKVTDAYMKERFGPDYVAAIETEVERRLKVKAKRRDKARPV